MRCRVLALSAIVPGMGTKSVIEVSAAFSFPFPLGEVKRVSERGLVMEIPRLRPFFLFDQGLRFNVDPTRRPFKFVQKVERRALES